MTAVVLIHDSACGLCSGTARRLAEILTAEVRLRSCRDPHLVVEYSVLRPHLTAGPCRRPLAVIRYDDGRAHVAGGLPMVARLMPLVRPRRWPAAIGLSARVLLASSRRANRRQYG